MGVSQLWKVVTWNWVTNARFRTAELTAAVLCVSAPEIGSLFHTRKRGKVSTSIVNGNYRRDIQRRIWTSRGVSMLNQSNRTMNSECYLELHEGNRYDPKASRENNLEEHHMPGEVNVTQEIRVVSHVV